MTAKSGIAERLRATLAKELKQDVNTITPQHTLRDDLGLNSLDAIELMFKIEEEFDISIPDEDMQRLVTVGDVISYLETKTGGGRSQTPATGSRTEPVPSSSTASTAPPRAKSSAVPLKGKVPERSRAAGSGKSASVRKTESHGKPTRSTAKPAKSKGSRRHA